MRDGLYQVEWRGICAGFIVEAGVVTRCAPVLQRNFEFFKSIATRLHESSHFDNDTGLPDPQASVSQLVHAPVN